MTEFLHDPLVLFIIVVGSLCISFAIWAYKELRKTEKLMDKLNESLGFFKDS
jgi:hypothetical protein